MTKQELIRDMDKKFNQVGLLNITQIAKYRNMGRKATSKFLQGLEYTTDGKCKLYFVGDIAQRILDNRK